MINSLGDPQNYLILITTISLHKESCRYFVSNYGLQLLPNTGRIIVILKYYYYYFYYYALTK